MKQMRHIFLALLVSAAVAGCDSFLSKVPSPTTDTPIREVSQLDALYDYITSYIQEDNPFAAQMHDDGDLTRELYLARPRQFDVIGPIIYHTFYTEAIIKQAADGLWKGEYNNIFKANTIINSVEKVSGSEEAKQAVKCNAHFLRAYSYFNLAQYYCKPYSEANKQSLGLPKRLGTDFEESLQRVSLDEIYRFILSDLEVASAVKQETVDPEKPWRISRATVNALYARVYLAMGDYAKAQTAAENALKGAPSLLDFNTLTFAPAVAYPAADGMPAQEVYESETAKWRASKYLFWKEFVYPRVAYNVSQWYKPSAGLTALFDTTDCRFDLFFVEHGNRRFSVPYESYRYNQFDDGRQVLSGITTAELYLIKAETQIRQGAWQDGVKTLDALREKRYQTDTYQPLTVATQAEALKAALDERRREMPFTARIPDIKRYSVNETPDDDVTVVREFFEVTLSDVLTDKPKTYTIAPNSPQWVMPINQIEIDASHGAIQQNPY